MHICICIANYLSNVVKKKTILLDMTHELYYRQAQIILDEQSGEENIFEYNKIIFSLLADERAYASLPAGKYLGVVMDFGVGGDEKKLFETCHIRIMACRLNPRNLSLIIQKTIFYEDVFGKFSNGQDIVYMGTFYMEKCRKLFEQATGKKFVSVPYEADGFVLHREMMIFLKRLLKV